MPVEEIDPWGTEQEKPHLSWFGLTDGWFWIEVGGQEFFRYSQAAWEYWAQLYPDATPDLLPYTNYQVARYWEDLIEMLPAILDPLPADFAVRVADVSFWRNWANDVWHWQQEREEDDAAGDTYEAAVTWLKNRTWNAGHLAHPPHIYLWRDEETIHILWDNRDVTVGDGIPVWTATSGHVNVSVSEFVLAVRSFTERFLSEMGQRVDAAVTEWTRPEVEIDFSALEYGQQQSLGLLEPALNPWVAQVKRAFSWEEDRAAILAIEQALSG